MIVQFQNYVVKYFKTFEYRWKKNIEILHEKNPTKDTKNKRYFLTSNRLN